MTARTTDLERQALLRRLSARHPSFLVWKNLDRALLGQGDVDAAAPLEDAVGIAADAREAAADLLRAETAITCQHVPDKYLTFFVQPHRLPQLFELDICTQPSRGLAPWAQPRRMQSLSIVGPNGIRRLGAGAEAVVSLVLDALSPNGAARLSPERQQALAESLALDWSGATLACRLLVPLPARAACLRLAEACVAGRWERRLAMLTFYGFLASATAHPEHALRRSRFRARLRQGDECVMSRLARLQGRRVAPEDLASLLAVAAREGHQVRTL